MTSGGYDASDLSLNGAGGVTKRRKPQTSREAFELYTINKLKLINPSTSDEFINYLTKRDGDSYVSYLLAEKWRDWQAATQFACS